MAAVKKGDVVVLEYTGRLASSGAVFDTTDEGAARLAGIYDQNAQYGPKVAVFGVRAMIPGIEGAVAAGEVGRQSTITLPPEKAFGSRENALVRMLPEKEFARQGIRPETGMVVKLDGVLARVKSITSGRVVVDFNHPLAGETVVYDVKVNEVISDGQKKVEAILSSFRLSAKVQKDGELFKITTAPGSPKAAVDAARRTINMVLAQAEVE